MAARMATVWWGCWCPAGDKCSKKKRMLKKSIDYAECLEALTMHLEAILEPQSRVAQTK